MQSLKRKLGNTFKKSMILKDLKKELVASLSVKLLIKNHHEGKKQYFSKTKGLIM